MIHNYLPDSIWKMDISLSSLQDLKIIQSKVTLREKKVRLVKFIYQENNNGDL